MQISSANLLIAGAFASRGAAVSQAGSASPANPAQQKAADGKFVPIDFKKAPASTTSTAETASANAAASPSGCQRPGTQLDIRV